MPKEFLHFDVDILDAESGLTPSMCHMLNVTMMVTDNLVDVSLQNVDQ